jgi:hypothetical protein
MSDVGDARPPLAEAAKRESRRKPECEKCDHAPCPVTDQRSDAEV